MGGAGGGVPNISAPDCKKTVFLTIPLREPVKNYFADFFAKGVRFGNCSVMRVSLISDQNSVAPLPKNGQNSGCATVNDLYLANGIFLGGGCKGES